MKKIILPVAILFATLQTITSKSYAQANTSLSNLTSPTAVNANLLPKQDNKINIGSAGKSWGILFLDSSIYLKDSLFIHKGGVNNTFMGEQAGSKIDASAHDNVGIGSNALRANTMGFSNTGAGSFSLFNNSTGNSNTGVGYASLYSNTSGFYNSALGSFSLWHNTTGTQNTAVGAVTLYNNTTGAYNTATGMYALYNNTTGNQNTANGYDALNGVTTGSLNTAVGESALSSITTQSNNTALGGDAGNFYGGTSNTFVGYHAIANGNNYSNSSAFGNQAAVSASNQVRIGNSSVTSIGGQVNWSTLSDARAKKNIKQNVPGLSFIKKLNPVTYNLDLDAIDAITKPQAIKDAKGNAIKPAQEEIEARDKKEQIVYTGLIAQEVEKAAQEMGYDFSGVDAAKNDKDLYALRYSDFVMPLIKAVQELSKINDERDATLNNMQKQIDELSAKVTVKNNSSATAQVKTFNQVARLEQNQPNPTAAAASTTIKYFIPAQSSKALIKVTNASGQEIKSINISDKNNGQVSVATNALSNGSYFYSLIIDGKVADTKTMIISH